VIDILEELEGIIDDDLTINNDLLNEKDTKL
jgi:hypothetical protein